MIPRQSFQCLHTNSISPPVIIYKISVLLLEDGFYEETVFTDTQEILSRTFPELAIPTAHFVNAVDQVFTAGNLSQGN